MQKLPWYLLEQGSDTFQNSIIFRLVFRIYSMKLEWWPKQAIN
uniref:Uncharacterized protein n=1 Tax=Rhizophora mucronata TaxID=61149 RepID=A0A2P2KX79_RHIMU